MTGRSRPPELSSPAGRCARLCIQCDPVFNVPCPKLPFKTERAWRAVRWDNVSVVDLAQAVLPSADIRAAGSNRVQFQPAQPVNMPDLVSSRLVLGSNRPHNLARGVSALTSHRQIRPETGC